MIETSQSQASRQIARRSRAAASKSAPREFQSSILLCSEQSLPKMKSSIFFGGSNSNKISIIYSQNKHKNTLNVRNIGTPLNATQNLLENWNPSKNIKTHNLIRKCAFFLSKNSKSRGGTTGNPLIHTKY